jgi:hypothetical protein
VQGIYNQRRSIRQYEIDILYLRNGKLGGFFNGYYEKAI